MKYPFCLNLLILAIVLPVAACGRNSSPTADKPAIDQASPAAPTTSAPPPPIALSPTPDPAPSAASPATPTNGETFKEKSGAFEVTLPKGYTQQASNTGVSFTSGDNGFGGSIDFGSAQGKRLTTKQLEDALKQEYESRLSQVSWQDSKIQPDGSVRIDWVGRDKQNNDLDAISFVEQQGDSIFILNLFGINKSYQSYNSDAEAIVKSYKVRRQ